MKSLKITSSPLPTLGINLIYAVYNCTVGVITRSWWFVTLGAYYIVLSVMRFAVMRSEHTKDTVFCRKFTGIMLIFLSICLSGTVVLSAVEDRGVQYHKIVMITIALYTFTKLTLGIINLVKDGKTEIAAALRSISLADAFASIFSLQRSMLVSFPGMAEGDIRLMNILTGAGVCVIVLLLGMKLIGWKAND